MSDNNYSLLCSVIAAQEMRKKEAALALRDVLRWEEERIGGVSRAVLKDVIKKLEE